MQVSRQAEDPKMNSTAVGVDIAKMVFQAHYLDQDSGEILNKQIKRSKFLEFFGNRAPCRIGWRRVEVRITGPGGSRRWAIS
jgi:hypothetical protein